MAFDIMQMMQLGMQAKAQRENMAFRRSQAAAENAIRQQQMMLNRQNINIAEQNLQARLQEIDFARGERQRQAMARQKAADVYASQFPQAGPEGPLPPPDFGGAVQQYNPEVYEFFKAGGADILGREGTYKQLFGESPTGMQGGSSFERLLDKAVGYIAKPDESLTPEQAAEKRWVTNYVEKAGIFAPGSDEKLNGFVLTQFSLLMDPNTPEEKKTIIAHQLNAIMGREFLKGAERVETTGAGGEKYVEYVPAFDLDTIVQDASVRAEEWAAMSPLAQKRQIGPAKSVTGETEARLADAQGVYTMLTNMRDGLVKYGGIIKRDEDGRMISNGAYATLQTYFPFLFGDNPAADAFYSARPRFLTAMQSFVKGTPSDRDMKIVAKTVPQLVGPRGLNIEKYNQMIQTVGDTIRGAIATKEERGVEIPGLWYTILNEIDAGGLYIDPYIHSNDADLLRELRAFDQGGEE